MDLTFLHHSSRLIAKLESIFTLTEDERQALIGLPMQVMDLISFGNWPLAPRHALPTSLGNTGAVVLLDVTLAALGLVLLAPPLALVAVLVRLDSPGPVLFRQTRTGQNGWLFRIYKFRTMWVLENGAHVQQVTRGDPRVTRIGRILRTTSIDELPQLLNVLRGEMALVGPRPHALAHDESYGREIPQYGQRFAVKPGITGWAQVNGARGETPTLAHMRRRVELDLWYVRNRSLALNLQILVRTVTLELSCKTNAC